MSGRAAALPRRAGVGVRYSIRLLHALSDFGPAERGLMEKLWDEFFVPARGMDLGQKAALAQEVCARHDLPGSVDDWTRMRAREFAGERYFALVDRSLPPPFPYGLDARWIYLYAPVPPAWHVLFGAPERELRDDSFLVGFDAARRHFTAAFAGVWDVLCWASGNEEPYRTAAPPGSPAWHSLRRVFQLFPFEHYLWVLQYLTAGAGPHAAMELDFLEDVYHVLDPHQVPQRRAAFHETNESLNRILRLIPGELPALVIEPLVAGAYEWTESVVRWMHCAHGYGFRAAQYLLTEEELSQHRDMAADG